MSTDKNQISDIFSARLEEVRNAHNKRQSDIAEIAGVGQSAVSAWLQGSKAKGGGVVPTGVELARLASELGVTVDWLLGRDTSVKIETLTFKPRVSEDDLTSALEAWEVMKKNAVVLAAAMNKLEKRVGRSSSTSRPSEAQAIVKRAGEKYDADQKK